MTLDLRSTIGKFLLRNEGTSNVELPLKILNLLRIKFNELRSVHTPYFCVQISECYVHISTLIFWLEQLKEDFQTLRKVEVGILADF